MTASSIGRALAALRDVSGVHGSFVLRLTGELAGRDLPAVFQDELFVEVGARLARFVETMTTMGDEVSSAILRFDEHRLYVARFPHGLLAVITTNDVNVAALRMALTLTTRRIEPDLLALLTSPPPPVAISPSATPPPAGLAGSHGAPRTYRGRVISG
jgi:predicted regulator of Ras-like GTPase activity (Roadblock/LC7/MglB family)